MTVTSQPLNYLPGLLLCSQIIPGLVKKNNNTVGGIIQGSIIFAMVRVQWECVSTSATHRWLLAGSWLNLLKYHLYLRPLTYKTHTHNLNQQAKLGLWHVRPRPTIHTSDCLLPPSCLLRLPAFRSLLSLFLAPIHKKFTSIWQTMDWLPSCMVMQRWTVHQLHMSWSTLTHLL